MNNSYFDSLQGETMLPWLQEKSDSFPGTHPDQMDVLVNSTPEKQGWPVSGKGYPPVTIRIREPDDSGVGRTGALKGLCLVLVVLTAVLIGVTAGVAIGHFLGRPVAITQKCAQTGAVAFEHVKPVIPGRLEMIDDSGSGEVEFDSGSGDVEFDSGSGEVDPELIYLRNKSLAQCYVETCYTPPFATPLLTFSTQDVEYYMDTGMNLLPYNTLLITLRACDHAYIGLLTEKGVINRDMIEVIIGAENNAVGIRSCHDCRLPYYHDMEYIHDEEGPLTHCDEYKRFWLHWDADTVRLGRYLVPFQNELIARPNPLGQVKPEYLTLNTGFDSTTGHWLILFESH